MILVDFETTDLLNKFSDDPDQQPGIVEIGLIELDGKWNTVHEYCFRVNPEKQPHQFAAKAVEAHGIKPGDVYGEPSLTALLPQLAAIFRPHDRWIGFNNEFDKKVLNWQLLRYGWGMRFPWPSIDVDIMKIGKDVANIQGKQDIKFPKLMELHQFLFGEGFQGAHGALADCQATARCGKELYNRGIIT